ncbi:MAG: galactose-1-phosphate uridylyltransferase, partial [Actinomycetota bacterium]
MREPPAPVATGPGVWRDSGRLADGREIIYFDESPGTGRAQVRDPRDLGTEERPAPGPESGLRWDPLLGEWVVIAAQRQGRTFLPPAEHCPLDPSRPGRPTEIPAPDYDVVVFENRFPSLYGAAPGVLAALGGTDGLITTARPAFGRCEVVCFTSDHGSSFAQLPARRVRTVVEAWADRSAGLAAMDGITQVFCFENRGEEIGVTLHHPHGQIYAFPFVTPRTTQIQAQAQAYARGHRGNLFDDVVAAEIAAGTRLVARNAEWTAFVPTAARWPYEILLFPARRVPDLPSLDEGQRAAFSELYTDVLSRLDAIFAGPAPYIAAWYQAPAGPGPASSEFGLHLRVMSVRRAPGKLKYLAGTESGMGVWINDVVP